MGGGVVGAMDVGEVGAPGMPYGGVAGHAAPLLRLAELQTRLV
jgi:hypothetical protein